MIKSTAILQLLRAIKIAIWFAQTPGRRVYQYLASGRQVRRDMRDTPTPKAITNPSTAYAVARNTLFERKIVM